MEDVALEKGAAANPPDTFRLLFDQVADEHFADMIDAFSSCKRSGGLSRRVLINF